MIGNRGVRLADQVLLVYAIGRLYGVIPGRDQIPRREIEVAPIFTRASGATGF